MAGLVQRAALSGHWGGGLLASPGQKRHQPAGCSNGTIHRVSMKNKSHTFHLTVYSVDDSVPDEVLVRQFETASYSLGVDQELRRRRYHQDAQDIKKMKARKAFQIHSFKQRRNDKQTRVFADTFRGALPDTSPFDDFFACPHGQEDAAQSSHGSTHYRSSYSSRGTSYQPGGPVSVWEGDGAHAHAQDMREPDTQADNTRHIPSNGYEQVHGPELRQHAAAMSQSVAPPAAAAQAPPPQGRKIISKPPARQPLVAKPKQQLHANSKPAKVKEPQPQGPYCNLNQSPAARALRAQGTAGQGASASGNGRTQAPQASQQVLQHASLNGALATANGEGKGGSSSSAKKLISTSTDTSAAVKGRASPVRPPARSQEAVAV